MEEIELITYLSPEKGKTKNGKQKKDNERKAKWGQVKLLLKKT